MPAFKLSHYPSPIALRSGTGTERSWPVDVVRLNVRNRGQFQPEITRRILQLNRPHLQSDRKSGRVLSIEEARQAEDPCTVGARTVAAECLGEPFQHHFLLGNRESLDAPNDLMFPHRSVDHSSRWRHGIRFAKSC